MNSAVTLTPSQLPELLLHVAVVRPVFLWGPPGIGKSALVAQFADSVGLECVSLLGSQLAPEDLIGVPQIEGGVSRFCPPKMIAKEHPYCLFLDELNACSHEVQKAFYSLVHERRVGEYRLPPGSVVIGAGNRAQDAAIVKPMSSALLNRMLHVHLKVSARDWLKWAGEADIHPMVRDYIHNRPDHLWSPPPAHEEPFSTPRAWHMLSDVLRQYGDRIFEPAQQDALDALAFGCLSAHHAGQFKAFVKQLRSRYGVDGLLKGDLKWPSDPEDRDVLYFLAQSLRARLVKELPAASGKLSGAQSQLAIRAKDLIKDLSRINLEVAQMMASDQGDEGLPGWFLVELVRDLPRLAQRG